MIKPDGADYAGQCYPGYLKKGYQGAGIQKNDPG